METYNYTPIKDKLTIIIPSYNEVNYIGKTLFAIKNQRGIGGTRVIICDNNSTDGTKDEINYYKIKYKNDLKIEIQKGGKVGRARNIGANLSKTKYLLFLDADAVLTKSNQIKDALNIMEKGDLDLITCQIKSISKSITSKIAFWFFNYINKIISIRTPFAVGTFFLTKKDKFFEYGQFDETAQHSEDFLLSKKYNVEKFKIIKHKIGQDDRRFKKMGYVGMIKLLIKSFKNRNNNNFFKNDVGYWD